MGKLFILLGIHVTTTRRVQRRRVCVCVWGAGGGLQETRQRYDKSRTSKIYTNWARILIDLYGNVLRILRGGGKTVGSNALGAFLVLFLKVTCPRLPIFTRPN